MATLTIRKIGNSEGVILPKEILARLRAGEGDQLYLTETPNGFSLHPYDPTLAEDMEVGEDIARRYRSTLKKLAE